MAQPPTVQRAIMNRHHQARRSNSSIAPKLEPGATLQSPSSRPTPPSHTSSPTAMSPGFNNPGVMTPPSSENQAHFQQQQQQRLHAAKLQPALGIPGAIGLVNNTSVLGPPIVPKGTNPPVAAAAAPPATTSLFPNFKNHYEQLGKLSRPLSFSFAIELCRPRFNS
jgi:hypothetical protein